MQLKSNYRSREKVDAAVKTAEAEAKKAATGAIKDATKDIKKPAGF